MNEGSNVSALAAVLFAVAIVFAAATVPTLASYSPGGGLAGIDEELPEGDRNANGSAGALAGQSGSGGSGLSLPAGGGSAGGAPPLGLAGGVGGPGGSAPDGLRALFAPFLDWFAGGSTPVVGSEEGSSEASSDSGGGEDASSPEDAESTQEAGSTTPEEADSTADGGEDESGETDGAWGTDRARGIGVAVFAVLVLVLAVYLYRSDRSALAALAALPSVVRQLLVRAFLAVSEAVEELLRVVAEAPSPLAVPGALWATLVASLRSYGVEIRAAVPDVGGANVGDEAASAAAGTDREPPARERIRETWKLVVDAVTRGNYRTLTPGEVEAAAIDEGLPADEVTTLAESFRDVEYGDEVPSERVDTATSAASTIRDHVADHDGADEGGVA